MSEDVFDHILHEHRHLLRLFDDVHQTFSKVSAGHLAEEDREDALLSATEDLEIALEDMILHFNQEEEVLFVEIGQRFPDLKQGIESLVMNHEKIAEHTRWLLTFSASRGHTQARFSEALKVVALVRDAITSHTHDESRIYGEALSRMDAPARTQMLNEMKGL